MYPSNVSIINIYQTIAIIKSIKFFPWIFSNTSNDTVMRKTKPDIDIFFTQNFQHLSTINLILLKRFSVFDWLLSFKTSLIPAFSGVYIFKFTSRYYNNCLDVVPGNDRCFAFPIFKALLKLYILILLGMLSLKINRFSCSVFWLLPHYKIYHRNYWFFGKCCLIF